jgi:histidinol-phosphatase (PHP family)
MSLGATKQYFSELSTLKEKYKDRISVFSGLEIDAVYPVLYPQADYHIGSIHFLPTISGMVTIDDTPKLLKEGIDMLGGPLQLARAYYDTFVDFAKRTDFDIVGHFDLITKFDEQGIPLFDHEDRKYQDIALAAMEAIGDCGKIFEVNTGAISRGYRTQPYPDAFLLRRIKELGFPICLSSDAHRKEDLVFGFEKAEMLLRSIGFTTLTELTDSGFVQIQF